MIVPIFFFHRALSYSHGRSGGTRKDSQPRMISPELSRVKMFLDI